MHPGLRRLHSPMAVPSNTDTIKSCARLSELGAGEGPLQLADHHRAEAAPGVRRAAGARGGAKAPRAVTNQ